MNVAKILHDTAMDFYDMAKIAKAKGNVQGHNDYMLKALAIEKEAALKLPEKSTEGFWPYAYLRSAAWMAFHLGQYDEAKILIQLALLGQPSAFEKERLNEILNAIASRSSNEFDATIETEDNQNLTGFLISIDVAQREVVVQTNDKEYRHLILPEQLLLAPFLLGRLVTVRLKHEGSEKMVVQDIRLAA